MKKTLLILALVAGSFGCSSWAEANRDARELRSIHAIYRANVVAKVPADQAKVDELGARIDSILAHLDTVTK